MLRKGNIENITILNDECLCNKVMTKKGSIATMGKCLQPLQLALFNQNIIEFLKNQERQTIQEKSSTSKHMIKGAASISLVIKEKCKLEQK